MTVTNGMLATPSIIDQDPTTGAYNFVQYDASAGFQANTAATVDSLATSAITSLADLSGASPITVGSGTIDIYAVRTSADIAPTDSTSVLRINNGGLIINAGTASPTISSNLFFGAGTSAAEAFVYVSGGAASHSTVSGSFTATNFTKSGNGNLLLSGTNNVMAPTTTGLRILTVNEGTVSVAGQSSLPSGGLILVSPQDSGTFDINGNALTIGGLTGTGVVTNSGTAQALTLAVNNQSVTFNGQISGGADMAVNFQGTGTEILGRNDTYAGMTTIGVGNITSASGLYTANGTLQANSYLGLGTNSTVTLAGGNLTIGATPAGNEVEDNFLIESFGAGNGYNLVIAANASIGTGSATGAAPEYHEHGHPHRDHGLAGDQQLDGQRPGLQHRGRQHQWLVRARRDDAGRQYDVQHERLQRPRPRRQGQRWRGDQDRHRVPHPDQYRYRRGRQQCHRLARAGGHARSARHPGHGQQPAGQWHDHPAQRRHPESARRWRQPRRWPGGECLRVQQHPRGHARDDGQRRLHQQRQFHAGRPRPQLERCGQQDAATRHLDFRRHPGLGASWSSRERTPSASNSPAASRCRAATPSSVKALAERR
ncbi:MAG: hypothetical protein WDN28_13180 [Chthoniobacter sp.]